MIERILIDGYRRLDHLDFEPIVGMNIIVGDNESGKSTLLEAIALALTGKCNGRWANEELNPFWFSQSRVTDYFAKYGTDQQIAPPEILIEIYLSNNNELQRLRGVHNSLGTDCPGVAIHIAPSESFEEEFKNYLEDASPSIVPVEFYDVDWRDFSDQRLNKRPKELATAFIDARTIRSTSGVDYHTREMLSEHLDSKERASISIAHRKSRQKITDETLAAINTRIAASSSTLHDRPIGLQMDQSSRTSWEVGIVPQVDGIPFAMSGQGQQAAIKVSLAMSQTAGVSTFVLIEEPENHLAYTSLNKLVARIEKLALTDQQLFITTHSSFVLNRLGLDRLVLLHKGKTSKLTSLSPGTVAYFRKLSGYDTLRLVLARKLALVEGPSDALVFERAFIDATTKTPESEGIDVVSMGGLTFKRALEVCQSLDRDAVALQDNDGNTEDDVRTSTEGLLESGKRELLVSDPDKGRTLETQILAVNEESTIRRILGVGDEVDLQKWMLNNKTESALRILDNGESIIMPGYISRAVDLLR